MATIDPNYTDPFEEPSGFAVPDYYVAPEETTSTTSSNIHGDYLWTPWGSVRITPETLDEAAKESTITVIQAGDPLPYVFGRTTVKPYIYCAHADADYLYVDFILSVGECNSIVSLIQGGEDIGKPSDGFEYFLGTSGQSASTLMAGALGASYDALPDICHFVARLDKDDSMDFRVVMEGIKTYDPRTSPQAEAYSTNPALALARVLSDSGYTLDWDSVGTVADYCDQSVSGDKRWELNLAIKNRLNIGTWVKTLSQYASCFVDIDAGNASFVPDAPVTTSPVITRNVNASDIVAGSAVTKKVGSKSRPKQVTVTYREEDGTQRTAVVGSGLAGERSRLQLPGFQSYTMAKRFATEVLNKAQADLIHEHIARDTALSDTIGDLHDLTYAPHGLSSKRMRLVGITEVDRGRHKRRYVEYDPALYNSSVFTAPSVSDTNLPSPNTPVPGPVPTVQEELFTDETATTYSRLKITFTGVSWPYTQAYKVTCDGEQNVLNALVAHDGQVTHTVYTAALKQGVTYTVKTYVQSRTGALSATPGQASATAAGKLLPPGDVTGFTAYEAGTLVAMSWNPAEEIEGDLRGYQIRRLSDTDYTGAASDWTHANVALIASRVDATTFLTSAQPEGDWYYLIRAIDSTGTLSTNYASALVTVTADAGSVSAASLTYGTLTNMHAYTIDGGEATSGVYVITSTGQTWAQRFGDTSPLATWGDAVTQSPAERWGGDLATDSTFETEVWDVGAVKSGNWWYDTTNITLLGGTQSNIVSLGDNSSPIVYTNHSGNTVQASGQNFKAVSQTTDSPASAGDGLHVKLPISVSYTGKIIDQEGTATIAATSPLDNPEAVIFPLGYSAAPDITLTPIGSSPIIVAADNITSTGFDLYIWDTAGAKTSGSVAWSATGA